MGLSDVLKDLFGIEIKIKRSKKKKKRTSKIKTKRKKKKRVIKKPRKKTRKAPKKKPKKKVVKKAKKKPKKKVKRKVKKKPKLKPKKKAAKKTPKKKPKPSKRAAKKRLAPTSKKSHSKPQEKEIGLITHYFGKISVGIIKLKSELIVGDKIRIKGAHSDFTQLISTMQLNHKEILRAKKGDEVGIRVSKRVHENDKVYLVASK